MVPAEFLLKLISTVALISLLLGLLWSVTPESAAALAGAANAKGHYEK